MDSAFIPYPVSTLSPPIVPNNLTSFKTAGLSSVEKELRLKLENIKAEYIETINHYNWNTLVYSSDYAFEPVIGNTYYLYKRGNGTFILSMISPDDWYLEYVATVKLNIDRQFEVIDTGDVDEHVLFGSSPV
ncbi:DUF2452 domain-containing protein [bacterium]|nr:DUF2452 domain-containing protein [bacterium]